MYGKATMTWDATVGAYKLSFPYNEDFIATLKGLIPAGKRDYDPKLKTWWVNEEYYLPLKTLMEHMFTETMFFEKPPKEFYEGFNTASVVPVASDITTFAQLCTIPIDRARSLKIDEALKLYRKAAMRLHPDRNPNNAQMMSDLNAAWSRLKESYFK